MSASSSTADHSSAAATLKYPDFYDFEPFFTCEWILSYVAAHRKYYLNVQNDAKSALFYNKKKERGLSESGIRQMLDELVAQSYAVWDDSNSKLQCHVTHKKFEDWGASIYKWAQSLGQSNSVMTLYEIQAGDSARGTDFYGLPEQLLLCMLRSLESKGKATLMPSQVLTETGIKFHDS